MPMEGWKLSETGPGLRSGSIPFFPGWQSTNKLEVTMSHRWQTSEPEDSVFDGVEMFPAINIAETVDNLIEDRGIQEGATHAAMIARVARASKEHDVAADWDEVYRLILARRALD